MYAIPEKHVGFNDEAPPGVDWSTGTFIRPVEACEIRHIRPYSLWMYRVFRFSLLLALAIALMKGEDNLFSDNPELGILDSLFLPSFVSMFLILILYGYILKLILIEMIRSRPYQLFRPDWSCVYVNIENAATFDKPKPTSEDFGLLKIHPDYLEFEMMRHRARFQVKDISISIHNPLANVHGVRITCDLDPCTWSVSLVSPFQSWNIFLGASHSLSAKWLLKRIQRCKQQMKGAIL